MKDIEQLETICKKLYDDIEALYSIKNNVMENVDVLHDIGSISKNIFIAKKGLDNASDSLNLLLKSLENYISVIRCTAPPLVVHQDISQLISNTVFQFCKEHKLHYRILSAPVKVVLNENGKYYEPDIIIVFDSEKIKRDGCYGAPDIIFEIVSKSTKKIDYEEKRNVYLRNGVKEYFIVDPIKERVSICCNEKETVEKRFTEHFKIESIPGLEINLNTLLLSYLF